jgi:hypothetical protein
MKRINVRCMAVAALASWLGFGASVSAFYTDSGCLSLCQELTNDCIAQAQAGGGGTRHCAPVHHDCIAGCEQ